MTSINEKELKRKRAIYVQQRMVGVKHRAKMIKKLSEELFISVHAIYRDLKVDLSE